MTKTHISRVICYREKSTGNTFLAYYTYKDMEEAQKEAEEINRTKPEKLFNGLPANCDKFEYFASEQETMY